MGSWPTRPVMPVSRWRTGLRGGSAVATRGVARLGRNEAVMLRNPDPRSTTIFALWSMRTGGRGMSSPLTARTSSGSPTLPSTRPPPRESSTSARLRTGGFKGPAQHLHSEVVVTVSWNDRCIAYSKPEVLACSAPLPDGRIQGRVASCGDNAAMESFFSLPQKNVQNRRSWTTQNELRIAIVTWIERTYHRRRWQSRRGRLTPIAFEAIIAMPAALAA